MATTTQEIGFSSARRLGVLRVGSAAALTAGLFILLCWIGARIGIGPLTHMYIQLFTGENVSSGLALIIGLCWSLAGGFVVGGLFAWIYNLLAPIDQR